PRLTVTEPLAPWIAYPLANPRRGSFDGRDGYTLARPAVRFDEGERVRTGDRAEVAARRAPDQGGAELGREEAGDAARWGAADLLDCRHAVRLRRVHPPRDLGGDVPRCYTDSAIAACGGGEQPLLPSLRYSCSATASRPTAARTGPAAAAAARARRPRARSLCSSSSG